MTVVFPTCLADVARPGLGARVRALLARRRGDDVTIVRGTTCCGQPAHNAGYARDARRVARPTVRALARTTGEIVVPSGSCTSMIVHHWPELFAGTRDEARARAVAARVRELSAALAGAPPTAPPAPAPPARVVAYHGSCHLERGLGVRDEPRAALAAAGCEVREAAHASLCCGFGGTFAVKLTDVSAAMADEKLDELAATGARTVVGCDLSCLMHLEGRARARGLELTFRHLAEELEP